MAHHILPRMRAAGAIATRGASPACGITTGAHQRSSTLRTLARAHCIPLAAVSTRFFSVVPTTARLDYPAPAAQPVPESINASPDVIVLQPDTIRAWEREVQGREYRTELQQLNPPRSTAVLHGGNRPPVLLEVLYKEIAAKEREVCFKNHIYQLEVTDVMGKKTVTPVIVRDADKHPLTGYIRNVTFLRYIQRRRYRLEIPIHLYGAADCVGVKKGGFIMRLRSTVSCSFRGSNGEQIPEYISYNITKANIGTVIRVSDLKLPPTLNALPKQPQELYVITGRRQQAEEATTTAAPAAPAAPKKDEKKKDEKDEE